MTNYLWTDSEWNFKLLDRVYTEIAKIAEEELGLDIYPNQIEIITSEQMIDAYASIGLPIFYHHWSFGKHFTRDWNAYQKGQRGLAYEIIINSNPCIAYLMEENTMTMQALTISHASMGHCHFFKNNAMFQEWTDAESIVDYLVFARDYISKCETREGRAKVESFLDSCHALMNYGVNRYKRPAKLSVVEERKRTEDQDNYKQSKVNDLFDTLVRKPDDDGDSDEIKLFPTEPEENILYFCEKYAPDLPEWKREIIRIVRKIAQYFYPQGQCLTGNTYVYTRDGIRMIKDIVAEEGYHPKIIDVLSIDNKFEQTSHVYKRTTNSTVRIRTKLGRTIEGTLEHPIQTIQPDLSLPLTRLDQLTVGSRLVMKLGYDHAFAAKPAAINFIPQTHADTITCGVCEQQFGNLSTHIPTHMLTIAEYKESYSEQIIAPALLASRGKELFFPQAMNDNLARLFGYWVSEGSLDEYSWSVSNTDKMIIDDVISILKAEFGAEATVVYRDCDEVRQATWIISLCNTRFREFLTHCGVRSDVKSWTQEIPWIILQSNKSLIRQFLSALFEGNGCNSDEGITYTSTSKLLVEQIQMILCHFGIVSTIRKSSNNEHPAWLLRIISDFQSTFMTTVGFLSERKQTDMKTDFGSSPYSDVPYLKDHITALRAMIDSAPSKNKNLRRENLPYTSSENFSRNKIANQRNHFDYIEMVDACEYRKIREVIDPSNYYDEVVSIELLDEKTDVYDFTIPSNHLFMSDVYVSHNTKVCNEGCATYVHYRIMTRLHEKGLMTDGSFLEFLASHTNVVSQQNYDSKYYGGINPYALGFAMMMDIERICKQPTDEDRKWFPDIAGCNDEMRVLKDAWANYRDESFIRQFLSPKVIRDFKFFCVTDEKEEEDYEVSAIHNDAGYQTIRDNLADSHERHEYVPQIEVTSVNQQSRSLTLRYSDYRGRQLEKPHIMVNHIHRLWNQSVYLYDCHGNALASK